MKISRRERVYPQYSRNKVSNKSRFTVIFVNDPLNQRIVYIKVHTKRHEFSKRTIAFLKYLFQNPPIKLEYLL